ncbi:MAG: hypothetical protein DMD54_04840 [Gemmatimonadetes bacterium]|nr:MAG: hypothetical protein DMD54_04840 [Gemmatimonadota bacterium]
MRGLFALVLATGLLASSACGRFQKQADAKFGDQNFKSAIALIELHKVRFGSYPDHLSDLRFTGDWDQIWMSAVKYTKLSDGYELDLVRGWVGTPDLSYPPEFWRGLGIRRTNVRRAGGA